MSTRRGRVNFMRHRQATRSGLSGRYAVRGAVVCLLGLATLLAACTPAPLSPPGTPSTLDPRGPGAARLSELWWLMFAISAFVTVLVIGLTIAAVLRRRRATADTTPEITSGDTGRNWILLGGIALPLVLLSITFGYSIYTQAAIDSIGGETLKIEVVGRRWWWEVKYPDQGVISANEMHIPVGVPVEVKLESGDVIHSFWVPQLHGKLDLIPRRANVITLQADEAGLYRGECAEYCGNQHAHMHFMVVAEDRAAFDAWISAQQQPASPPDAEAAQRGQQVFLEAQCVVCHTVRGLQDTSVDASEIDLGPDLTHLASRLTIAGASLSLNRGNLAGWIVDAQHVKPGALMPNMNLESEDLQDLLAYLESLR